MLQVGFGVDFERRDNTFSQRLHNGAYRFYNRCRRRCIGFPVLGVKYLDELGFIEIHDDEISFSNTAAFGGFNAMRAISCDVFSISFRGYTIIPETCRIYGQHQFLNLIFNQRVGYNIAPRI